MVVRIAGVVLGVVLLIVWALDIFKGEYVSQAGTISGHNFYITMECSAKDSKGNCTTYTPESHYQLVVSHGTDVTVVEVYVWEYFSRNNGDRVQISYWKGGLVGLKWFAAISNPQQDW